MKAGREVRVYVRDTEGRLIPGSRIEWSENNEALGAIPSSDGHADLHIEDDQSIIEVVARVGDQTQTRKLAASQATCTFEFGQQLNAAGFQPQEKSALRSPVVIAAVVALVGTLVVGYWQYGPISSSQSTLTVFVKDKRSGAPVPRADVVLQSSVREQQIADSQGSARFKLRGSDNNINVTAQAEGFDATSVNAASLSGASTLDLYLVPKVSPTPQPTNALPAAKVPVANLNGTWQVVTQGDITLQRISSGTLLFTSQPDGRALMTGRLVLNGVETTLDGQASTQGNVIFLAFDGKSGPTHWKGTGTLNRIGPNQLVGSLNDGNSSSLGVSFRRP